MIPFTHRSGHYPLTERKTPHLAWGTYKSFQESLIYPNPDKIPICSNRKGPHELLAGWKLKYRYVTGRKEAVDT